jgi:hypothetical protein
MTGVGLRSISEDTDLVVAAESRLGWAIDPWPTPRHASRMLEPRDSVSDSVMASDGRWTPEPL